MTVPFQYPTNAKTRIHGPSGYADIESYREWLRDEFAFRCVYCLIRETWTLGGFHLDHFIPGALDPQLAAEYTNLLYSCATCNLAKRDYIVPDPSTHMLAATAMIRSDGSVAVNGREAKRIVERLRLNRPTYCRFRRLWIGIVAMARAVEPELLSRILGYPDSLPELSSLNPPGGNAKPEGIEQSHLRRRERGELPATY